MRSVSSSANAPSPLPSTTPTRGPQRPCGLRCNRLRFVRSQQHSRDAGRHEVRHGPGRHRAQAEPRQVALAGGRQRADAADLNRDRAEIGEAAQRVGGDREGARIERAPSSARVSGTPRIRSAPGACPAGCRSPPQSFQGTPSSHATGAKTMPKTLLQRCRQPAQHRQRVQPSPESRCTIAISARNAISMPPMFSARCRPSPAPCAAASITLTAVFSILISTCPRWPASRFPG